MEGVEKSEMRVAHVRALIVSGSEMVDLLRRMVNVVLRTRVSPPSWRWEVITPIEKVQGCREVEKLRPIKLL